ncbi:hypothetical protein RHGRI_003499 [Rhododendron griersonianum]|uniref:RRM domain-containing protein n=1 Tax=Rhododendron griersonianum TaxID=479676 RepID=A0AAV6L7V9_9ERIC|nr:hypothetical protein RHGRI_003499 [Rhododendron griersonianum]KAG5560228.1 hypothetical protein RHGRI_003499 [Rhododendron griersonianum]KAG5560229.1 hypothetical protein RHGRI_003499 [Rhododendron griersonianum]
MCFLLMNHVNARVLSLQVDGGNTIDFYINVVALSVMRDPSRISRGSGFVAFSTSEEASRAAGFGYQQQLVPGMTPGAAPMPNFYMPLVHQGQQGQQPGGRRGGGPMMPRGRVYRYPPGCNMLVVSMPGVGGGMLSVPYDMGGMLP